MIETLMGSVILLTISIITACLSYFNWRYALSVRCAIIFYVGGGHVYLPDHLS